MTPIEYLEENPELQRIVRELRRAGDIKAGVRPRIRSGAQDPMSEPIDDRTSRAAALTSEELLRRTTQEFIDLRDSGAGMWLELHPAVAFAVVAMCQLALRHPDAAENASAPLVRDFIEYVRAKFEPHAPAIAEAIRRGNEPEHDTPRDRYLETAPNTKGRDWVRERLEAAAEPPEMEQERALLRRLLNSRDPLENARLTFGHEKHRMIFQRIMDLHGRGAPVDRVALANELMKNGELQAVGGLTYLVSLYEPPQHDTPRQATRDPRDGFLNCPYCGFSQPAPFENVDLYICGACGRTVETE